MPLKTPLFHVYERSLKQTTNTKSWPKGANSLKFNLQTTLGTRRVFFRSKAVIVSGKTAIEDLDCGFGAKNRSFATKKTLWCPGYLQTF